jgi:RimJ/RimL family protein N-acetyltransferase
MTDLRTLRAAMLDFRCVRERTAARAAIPPTSPLLLLDWRSVAGADDPVAETPRLWLRRLRRADLDAVAAMAADPAQMRFYPRPKSRDEVRAWLDWNLALYEEHGFGTWCLESRADGGFAGYCGIRPLLLDGRQETELAWHVKRDRWNRGLATEAARASARLGFGAFGLASLVAIVHPDNVASRRVAQKLGMTEERHLVHDDEPVVVHRATAG